MQIHFSGGHFEWWSRVILSCNPTEIWSVGSNLPVATVQHCMYANRRLSQNNKSAARLSILLCSLSTRGPIFPTCNASLSVANISHSILKRRYEITMKTISKTEAKISSDLRFPEGRGVDIILKQCMFDSIVFLSRVKVILTG